MSRTEKQRKNKKNAKRDIFTYQAIEREKKFHQKTRIIKAWSQNKTPRKGGKTHGRTQELTRKQMGKLGGALKY